MARHSWAGTPRAAMLKRRRWFNVALALVATGIFGAAYFGANRTPAPPPFLSQADPDAISVIEFGRPGKAAALRLERGGKGWRLTAPFHLPANDVRVAGLTALLRARSLGGFRAQGNDLTQFDLEPPLARLHLDAYVFDIGTTEPLDGRRYVAFEEQVHLIEDNLFSHLPPQAANYVHLAPLVDLGPVIGIETTHKAMRWDGRTWQATGFESHDNDWFNQRAENWQRLQAVAVRPLEERASWPERLTVSTRGELEPRVFSMRRSEHEVILARPALGIQYHLLLRTVDTLLSAD